jgi:hypothetical protein
VEEKGAKSGVERLVRMKRGSGIKGRDDESNGIEILMADTFAKIGVLCTTDQKKTRTEV